MSAPAPEIPELDFRDFHERDLPDRLAAGNGALARESVGRAGPLAFRLPTGEAYTYRPSDEGIEILSGDAGAETVVELEREAWAGLVAEFESVPGLVYGKRLRCTRGDAMTLMKWDPALRAMFSGRPYYDPEETLLARDGRPLDVMRAFALDDDPDEMSHFLRTAGFLLVRRVFSPEEIAAFLEEAARLEQGAVPGDKQSWWGRDASGEEILCRVTTAGREPRLGELSHAPRLLRLAELAGEGLVPRARKKEENVTVIWKRPEMKEGLGDLPWHRDCGMGGHAVMCPLLIASVFLTRADARTGALRALPGSWKTACHFIDARHEKAPRGVILEAEPGDVSLHFGDTMHAAPPPEGDGEGYRISAVTGFTKPEVRPHGGTRHYNDVLLGNEDGQVDHMSKVAREVS